MITLVQCESWESFVSASLQVNSASTQYDWDSDQRSSLGSFQTPEMDVQMRPVGYWGPVTATLDWCEVRYYRSTHLTSPPHSVFSGQLSVFTLCSRNLQHVLQSLLCLHISIWRTSVIEGILTHSLSRRIRCPSFLRAFSSNCHGFIC